MFSPSQPLRVIHVRAKQNVFLPQSKKSDSLLNIHSTAEDWIIDAIAVPRVMERGEKDQGMRGERDQGMCGGWGGG